MVVKLYKKAKLTNAWTLILIVFVFIIFIGGLVLSADMLSDQYEKGKINLSAGSQSYINKVYNVSGKESISFDEFKVSEEAQADPILWNSNESSGNPKDFAVEFYTTKEKSAPIRGKLQILYSIPSNILELANIPLGDLSFLIDTIGWLISVAIVITLINLWKGGS